MKKWAKVEDVSRLRDGQRVRLYTGSSFDAAVSRIGEDHTPRVYRKADGAVLRGPGYYDPKDCDVPSLTLTNWLHIGYTVEALEEEVDERARIAELWNQLELSLCAAIQETPTHWLSNRRWGVIELMMREIEATITELRPAAAEKEGGNG